MLILGRKRDQQVRVGENLIVRVIRVTRDGTVKLGFDAPKDLPILREEVYQKQQTEKAAAGAEDGSQNAA